MVIGACLDTKLKVLFGAFESFSTGKYVYFKSRGVLKSTYDLYPNRQ